MKVGFIGGGKMAGAIVSNLVRTGTLKPEDILVCEIDEARRNAVREQYGVAVTGDALETARAAEIAFLAVKPQDLDALLANIAPAVRPGQLIVSIAAGKRLSYLAARLPGARLVRVMPNLPATVSEGMSVFCAGKGVEPAEKETVRALLASFGRALELPEEQFDAVTALSGSGPAFLAYLLRLMTEGAVKLGLAAPDAELLAAQTMRGTATLLLSGEFNADGLIKAVSSPKGTTVAGFCVLTAAPLGEILHQTLAAAARRSAELSR